MSSEGELNYSCDEMTNFSRPAIDYEDTNYKFLLESVFYEVRNSIQFIYHEWIIRSKLLKKLEESRLQLFKVKRFCWKSFSKVNLVKVINISKAEIYVI